MIENFAKDFPEHPLRPGKAPLALDGVKVVDFTHFIAGPLATMILADMGAEIFKIEAPGKGDDFRQYPPMDMELNQPAPFFWANRNKKSVAVDLKSPEGLEIVKELIKQADILVENFSTGVMTRLGIDYETCKKINPKIIFCSVSAYGRDGEFADRLGFDPVAQAESGFVSMNGYADREGVRALSPVMDISTAMMVSNAILGAMFYKERSGEGQFLEVALFDNAVFMTGYAPMQYLFTGQEIQRHGNTSPDTCPSGVFNASDGSFYINSGNNNIFKRLMEQVVERPDVAADPRYATGKQRGEHREQIFKLLGDIFIEHPWQYWQAKMRSAGVPCGKVRSVSEALRSPEAMGRNIVTKIAHPKIGWVPNISLPIRYEKTPMANPKPAPMVGEDTLDVLQNNLGYSQEQIEELSKAGAFGKDAAGENVKLMSGVLT